MGQSRHTLLKFSFFLEDRGIPKASFEKFDKNDDGFISKAEFKKRIKSILKKLGVDYTNDEIMDAFNFIDSNGDGQISLDEFENVDNIPLGKRNDPVVVIIIIIIIVRK